MIGLTDADPDDINYLIELDKKCFYPGDNYGKQQFQDKFDCKNCKIKLLISEGKRAGYIIYKIHRGHVLIDSIAIEPEQQGKKYGEIILDWIHNRHPEKLFKLKVRRDNHKAISLYKKKGYILIGRQIGYYADGMMAYTMLKGLNDAI